MSTRVLLQARAAAAAEDHDGRLVSGVVSRTCSSGAGQLPRDCANFATSSACHATCSSKAAWVKVAAVSAPPSRSRARRAGSVASRPTAAASAFASLGGNRRQFTPSRRYSPEPPVPDRDHRSAPTLIASMGTRPHGSSQITGKSRASGAGVHGGEVVVGDLLAETDAVDDAEVLRLPSERRDILGQTGTDEVKRGVGVQISRAPRSRWRSPCEDRGARRTGVGPPIRRAAATGLNRSGLIPEWQTAESSRVQPPRSRARRRVVSLMHSQRTPRSASNRVGIPVIRSASRATGRVRRRFHPASHPSTRGP